MDSEEVYLSSVGKLASLVGTSEAALKILLSILIGKSTTNAYISKPKLNHFQVYFRS